jgi:glutamate--cysteine ligase catalytic subunit
MSCLTSDEQVLTLTNVALLGSSHMHLGCKSLVTNKQRYKDLMERLPGRAADSNGNYGHELQTLSAYSDQKGPPITINDPIDGFGGCGLQVTFSANDLEHACRLHDQLIPLGPLMLALSAATPMYKGRLVATDTRWETMCMAGDDRKSSEKPRVWPRLGCTPMYLEDSASAAQFNDRTFDSSDELEPDLEGHGLPAALATYFAHIFNRDPLIDAPNTSGGDGSPSSTLEARIELMNLHMSTWWPHVRLKLPVLSDGDTGLPWRVEFRPMEAQPSDMENAALVVAMRILQQTIQHFDLDLKIPISAIEENMDRANGRGAATDQMFRFAARIGSLTNEPLLAYDGWASLDTIFNGSGDSVGQTWLGLLPLANDFLVQRGVSKLSDTEQEKIFGALKMLSARASGKLKTPAKWMRTFVKENSDCELPNGEISSRLYYAMVLAFSE